MIFPPPPFDWSSGRIIAYGIRNPAGFAFHPLSASSSLAKALYVVENGASIDGISGLTPEFVNDNPADELERVIYTTGSFAAPPKSYGFPDCTTIWNPTADPVGVPQYTGLQLGARFSLNLDPLKDDNWCRSRANNQPPVLSFQVSCPMHPMKHVSVANSRRRPILSPLISNSTLARLPVSPDRSPAHSKATRLCPSEALSTAPLQAMVLSSAHIHNFQDK